MKRLRLFNNFSATLIALGTFVSVGCDEDSAKSHGCTDTLDDYCDENQLIRCTEGKFTPQPCLSNEYCGSQNGVLHCLPKDSTGCGDVQQVCCDNSTCNGSLSCINNICQATTACGGQGQLCCTGGGCNGNLNCINHICQACGWQGQPCCDNTCYGRLNCISNTCQACGGEGQDCCSGNSCNGSLNCISNTCQACGGRDQPCCSGICSSSSLICVDNACVSFMSLTSNTTTMKPGMTLELTARLIDPNGVNDTVSGGQLKDQDGWDYGTFRPLGTPGLYALGIEWGRINQIQNFNFPSGGGYRTFRATFTNRGRSTVETLTIKFECADSSYGMCHGSCRDLNTDYYNCGNCGNTCASGTDCYLGRCGCNPEYDRNTLCSGKCVDVKNDAWHCGGCNRVCSHFAPYSGNNCYEGSCLYKCFPHEEGRSCNDYCRTLGLSCNISVTGGSVVTYNTFDCSGSYLAMYGGTACSYREFGGRSLLCPCI